MKPFVCFFLKSIFVLSLFWNSSLEAQNNEGLLLSSERDFKPIVLDTVLQYAILEDSDIKAFDSAAFSNLDWISYARLLDTVAGERILGRLIIQKNSDSIHWCVISLNSRYDSLSLFKKEKDTFKFVGTTGFKKQRADNYFSIQRRIIPFTIDAKGTHNYYLLFSSKNSTRMKKGANSSFTLGPLRTVIEERVQIRGIQYLSEGLILLFALISLFMFFMFRELDFLYYFVIVLGLILFFQQGEGFIGRAIPANTKNFFNEINGASILFLGVFIFFMTLFVSGQLKLKKHWKKFWRIYFIFSVVILVSSIIMSFILVEQTKGISLGIMAILILVVLPTWLLLSFIAIIQGAIKKRGNAIILLIAISILIILPISIDAITVQKDNLLSFKGNFITTLIPFFGVIMYGMFSRIGQIRKDKISLQVGKEKSDELLYNILPAEVAKELIEKGESEAKLIDQVTVLFTDFKEFTSKASELSPKHLVEELHACFRAFDTICEKFEVEKIKTIGDAYMAAGGLNNDDPVFWVKRVIDAGLSMNEFMMDRKKQNQLQGKPYFEMRIGINTGPIVAGVVGIKKFQYDLWGDTVNIASRMESNGEVEQVNISQATYEFVKEDSSYVFEKRNRKEIKGKGDMQMWFVKQNHTSQ